MSLPPSQKKSGKFAEVERRRALRLANKIEGYWRERGQQVRCYLSQEDIPYPDDIEDPRNRKLGYAVRTRMINGLPQ